MKFSSNFLKEKNPRFFLQIFIISNDKYMIIIWIWAKVYFTKNKYW